jgi:hypothetical protein
MVTTFKNEFVCYVGTTRIYGRIRCPKNWTHVYVPSDVYKDAMFYGIKVRSTPFILPLRLLTLLL